MVVEIKFPLIRLKPVGACIGLCLKEAIGAEGGVMNKREYREAWGKWLGEYFWDFFITLTFKARQTIYAAKKKARNFLKKLDKESSYFIVVEQDASRQSAHVHILLSKAGSLSKESIEKEWKAKYGIVQVLPYDIDLGANYYVTKSVDTGRADWDMEIKNNIKTVKQAQAKIITKIKPYYENGVLKGHRISL